MRLLLVLLVSLLCGSAVASEMRLEFGLRFEALGLDADIEFECTCDPEEDPGCDNDPNFCRAARLGEPYSGMLFGGSVGAMMMDRFGGGGVRMAATVGPFDPDARTSIAEDAFLTHITFEVPIEAHVQLGVMELYAQAVPRFGILNYSEEEYTEDADTLTAGVMVMLGVRVGGERRVGAAGGAVLHPSIRGFAVDVAYQGPLSMAEISDELPADTPPADAPPADTQPADAPPADAPLEPAPTVTPDE